MMKENGMLIRMEIVANYSLLSAKSHDDIKGTIKLQDQLMTT